MNGPKSKIDNPHVLFCWNGTDLFLFLLLRLEQIPSSHIRRAQKENIKEIKDRKPEKESRFGTEILWIRKFHFLPHQIFKHFYTCQCIYILVLLLPFRLKIHLPLPFRSENHTLFSSSSSLLIQSFPSPNLDPFSLRDQ